MIDLREHLHGLPRDLSRLGGERGKTIMVIGANPDEGASSVAASLALLLAGRARRAAWLVDLDVAGQTQFRAFQAGFAGPAGRPGQAYEASLNAAPFYEVLPALRTANGETRQSGRLLVAHRIGATRLMVTRFRTERLRSGQRVQMRSNPAFWDGLKKIADWSIVDAPALETSAAALPLVRQMDGVILVFRADATNIRDVEIAQREVEGHGGRVLGLVMNEVRGDARLADRFAS